MPVRVDVPGKGIVEFPDGTTPDIMERALADFAQPAAPAQEAAEPGLVDRIKSIPGKLPGIVKDAAWKASGLGLFDDAAGGGATTGGMAGLAVGGPMGAIAGTALGATGGKLIDLYRRGEQMNVGNIAPRVAMETALSLPGAGIAKAGRKVMDAGRAIARSQIKPTVSAGAGEAQRRLGSRALASKANDEVIERGLDRNLLGGADPLADVVAARDVTSKRLDRAIGDQPTQAHRLIETVFKRGRAAADEAVMDIPGAQGTIEGQIKRFEGGRLGRDAMRPGPAASAWEVAEKSDRPAVPLNGAGATPRRRIKSEITARDAWEAAKSLDKQHNYAKPASDLEDAFTRLLSRANRVAAKRAAPEARPMLSQYGDETALINMLANPSNRGANQNQLMRLPTMLAAMTDIAQGRPPILGLLTNLSERGALQNAQRLYNAGKNAPTTAGKATAGVTGIRELLLSLLSGGSED
jgi:hypothetical protein